MKPSLIVDDFKRVQGKGVVVVEFERPVTRCDWPSDVLALVRVCGVNAQHSAVNIYRENNRRTEFGPGHVHLGVALL